MIVEEKMARVHWCPHVRHPGEEGGTFNRGFELGNEINKGRASGNWSCACIGCRCMAWRWADEDYDENNYPIDFPPKTRGYCGLAGRP